MTSNEQAPSQRAHRSPDQGLPWPGRGWRFVRHKKTTRSVTPSANPPYELNLQPAVRAPINCADDLQFSLHSTRRVFQKIYFSNLQWFLAKQLDSPPH